MRIRRVFHCDRRPNPCLGHHVVLCLYQCIRGPDAQESHVNPTSNSIFRRLRLNLRDRDGVKRKRSTILFMMPVRRAISVRISSMESESAIISREGGCLTFPPPCFLFAVMSDTESICCDATPMLEEIRSRLQAIESQLERLQHSSIVLSSWGMTSPIKCDSVRLVSGSGTFYQEAFEAIETKEIIVTDSFFPIVKWRIRHPFVKKVVLRMEGVRTASWGGEPPTPLERVFEITSTRMLKRKIREGAWVMPSGTHYGLCPELPDQVEVVEVHFVGSQVSTIVKCLTGQRPIEYDNLRQRCQRAWPGKTIVICLMDDNGRPVAISRA